MTPERHNHYRAVMTTIEELGPSKLQPGERATLTECAEDLLLSDDAASTREAYDRANDLLQHLVSSGRWMEVTAERLGEHLVVCGPGDRAVA